MTIRLMHLLQLGELTDELYGCRIWLKCFMFYMGADDHLADTGHDSIYIIKSKETLKP